MLVVYVVFAERILSRMQMINWQKKERPMRCLNLVGCSVCSIRAVFLSHQLFTLQFISILINNLFSVSDYIFSIIKATVKTTMIAS